MLANWVSRRMMLRCGARSMVLFSINRAVSASVATKPATMPLVEFDMTTSQIDLGDNDRKRGHANCVPLSQALHLEGTTRFLSYAACAVPGAFFPLARNNHFDRSQGGPRRHRGRRASLHRADDRQGQRQESAPPRQGRCDRRL